MAAKFDLSFTLGANTITQTSHVYADAAGQRFSDYIWAKYPQYDVDGNPLPDTNANRVKAFRDFADGYFQAIKNDVIRYEKERDAQAARDAVSDLT